jgi:hypothetical protein
MSPAAQNVLEQFWALSPEEQKIVRDGIDDVSNGPDLHPSWDAEIRRRISAAEKGEEKFIPMDEAIAKARRLLRQS